jgi:hypothetical protein
VREGDQLHDGPKPGSAPVAVEVKAKKACASLGFKLSIYDEEDDDLPAVASIGEAEERIRRTTQGAPACSIVVADDQLDLSAAQALAGPLSDSVGQAPSGYLIFRFLTP